VTDLPKPDMASDNCIWHYEQFSEVRKRISTKLGIETPNLTPYKLCDYKPSYGLLFEDLLQCYDWWGFGDIDVVLGNLKSFLPDKDLESFDIISFRRNWVSGSMALFRNTTYNRDLYKKIVGIQESLENPNFLGIDEVSQNFHAVRLNPISEVKFPYDNFTRVIFSEGQEGKLKLRFQDSIKEYLHPHEWMKATSAGLTDQSGNKTYPYYHLVSEKKRWFFEMGAITPQQESILLSHSGEVSASQIHKLGKVHFRRKLRNIPEYLARKFAAVKRRLG
jgi:hypothetical protein